MLLSILCCLSLSGGSSVSSSISVPLTEDLEEWKRALRSDDARERRKAVSSLAGLSTTGSWSLVIGALDDPAPQVADEAQLQLGGAPVSLVPSLLDKKTFRSKQELLPLRVAELIGRLADPGPAKDWIPLLSHKDQAIRRSLLSSIERQAAAGNFGEGDEALLEAVGRLADKGKIPAVRAHAALALAALSPERARLLRDELSGASEPELRAAAVELIPLLPDEERAATAARAARDEAPLVRRRAYEELSDLRSRDGARALVGCLEEETELRLSWHLTELLQDLSGMKYGRDPRPWKRWAETLPEEWAPSDEAQERDYGERTVAFVGLPILSGRIAFLIDFSGSMWAEREGKTRKEVVDEEMRRALEGLPETTEFNVYPYTGEPLCWQKKLVSAKSRNVRRALDYFEKCKAYGPGNFWDAALEAMSDPAVDTLMVLTDGAPSGGYRWNLKLMKELFAHENRFRGVFLDALLVDTSRNLQGYWEEMTSISGGRCLPVKL